MEHADGYGLRWEATRAYVRGLMYGLPVSELGWFAVMGAFPRSGWKVWRRLTGEASA